MVHGSKVEVVWSLRNPGVLAQRSRMTDHFGRKPSFWPETVVLVRSAGRSRAEGGCDRSECSVAKIRRFPERSERFRRFFRPDRRSERRSRSGRSERSRSGRKNRRKRSQAEKPTDFRGAEQTEITSSRSPDLPARRSKMTVGGQTTVGGQNDRSSGGAETKRRDSG